MGGVHYGKYDLEVSTDDQTENAVTNVDKIIIAGGCDLSARLR